MGWWSLPALTECQGEAQWSCSSNAYPLPFYLFQRLIIFLFLTFSFLCGTELVKRREESLFGGIRKIFQVLGTNPSLDNILVSKTSQLFLWNVANCTGAVLVLPRNWCSFLMLLLIPSHRRKLLWENWRYYWPPFNSKLGLDYLSRASLTTWVVSIIRRTQKKRKKKPKWDQMLFS